MRRTGRFAGEQLREWYRDQGYLECVRDILEHPVFQSMDQYIQHGTTTCKAHCIQVSYLGYKLIVKGLEEIGEAPARAWASP